MHSKVQSLIAVRESKLRLINPTKQELPHYVLSPIVSPHFISWRLFCMGFWRPISANTYCAFKQTGKLGTEDCGLLFSFFFFISLIYFYSMILDTDITCLSIEPYQLRQTPRREPTENDGHFIPQTTLAGGGHACLRLEILMFLPWQLL